MRVFGTLATTAMVAALATATPSLAQSTSTEVPTPAAPEAAALWRAMFERDLEYLIGKIRTDYIYASYPAGAPWEAQFDGAIATARREAALVRDFASYRAVLQHFIVSFEDAHLSAYFNLLSRRTQWPGFTVRYGGDRFVIDKSMLSDAPAGATVESCDGEPITAWVDRLTSFLGGPKGLDTTRGAIGRAMFVDDGNPLYRLPATCRIGARDVTLKWTATPAALVQSATPERTSAPAATIDDPSIGVTDVDQDTAWVRIGTMLPIGNQVAQFRQLIAQAPALRDKGTVVIDVRGNSGGVYNWFMAFLRAFYGQPYADHFARARLEIANVMLSPPGPAAPGSGVAAGFSMDDMPADPPMEASATKSVTRPLANGGSLTLSPAPIARLSYPRTPPVSPVRAKVYLLTDYGCASACISFVDEMRRFPGVVQIGTQTHIDRRSGGWPQAYQLPSGLALVRMGRMVREGRRRGENEAWSPAIRFGGDIADTRAVQKWFRDIVATSDAAQ